MKRITRLSVQAGYKLTVEFDDGVAGTLELEGDLFGPVFTPLRDEALFVQVHLDEFGVPCWPNGADLAPDAIYTRLTRRSIDFHEASSEPRRPL
jgi:hypothetical protein